MAHYDVAIAQYFNPGGEDHFIESFTHPTIMRYGENPHQSGIFFGNLEELFTQLNGKELSYNNLVDVDAAVQLMGNSMRMMPRKKTQLSLPSSNTPMFVVLHPGQP